MPTDSNPNPNSPTPQPPIPGCATLQGTERYAEKHAELHPGHFRQCQNLVFSSIGMGTYLGEATDEVDNRYLKCMQQAIYTGCNIIDTAINYRFQRSERAIGQALGQLIANGLPRDEIIVCTKGGFIPFDTNYPSDPYAWIEENLLNKGVVTPEEIHPSGHCMAPNYLYHQLNQSLRNLNLEKVDIYYVHNPETQISDLNEPRFYETVEMAFRSLENAVREGKIGIYGVATWDGFLENRDTGHLMQLERLVEMAHRAGGDQHCFRIVELPINLTMTDALNYPNQKVGDQQMTFLEAARALKICVVASASLLQAGLAKNLPSTLQQAITGLPNDAARALQFARSTPGVTTALVGMSTPAHVTANLGLASHPVMTEQEFNMLFGER